MTYIYGFLLTLIIFSNGRAKLKNNVEGKMIKKITLINVNNKIDKQLKETFTCHTK